MRTTPFLLLLALIASSGAATAQTSHTGHTGHTTAMAHTPNGLTETGQGAFAALSEAVRLLEADPETDWTQVDLNALRAHLVDMDRLVTDSIVTETDVAGGIRALATGDAATLATLGRMVPAHATQLATDTRWTVTTAATANGVELRVTSDDPATTARIRGLGFFGLMASQDHHRDHHLLIAQGKTAHSH